MPRNKPVAMLLLVGIALFFGLLIPMAAFAGLRAAQTAAPAATLTPTASLAAGTPTAAPVCGGPRAMFILLVGSDTRIDNYNAGLADSIRIVRVDFVDPGLMFIGFQRDLYVEIPGISGHGGITHGKLNQAYLYGNPGLGYYDGPGQGPGLLAATLAMNFGARVDHYVAVNYQTFVRMVDTLGGIDIDLPYPIDGRADHSADPQRFFPAGQQHLDGYRAMMLARLRPNGDLQRSDVQDLILKSLAARILAPENLPQMPRLIEAFYTSVQTDLGAADISRLLCLGYLLDSSKIAAVAFPPDLFTQGRIQDPVLGYTFIWDVDSDLLREYLQYFNKGSRPKIPLSIP